MFQIISKMRDVVDADQKTKRMGNGFLLYGLGRYLVYNINGFCKNSMDKGATKLNFLLNFIQILIKISHQALLAPISRLSSYKISSQFFMYIFSTHKVTTSYLFNHKGAVFIIE